MKFLWVNAREKRGLFFQGFKGVVTATEEDPEGIFDEVERLTKRGFFVAGFFCFELGYLLEPSLRPYFRRPDGLPLALLGVFEEALPFRFTSPPLTEPFHLKDLGVNTEPEEYERSVSRIKAYIASGDTYQVNFTFKHRFEVSGCVESLFWELLRRQKVRYAAFVSWRDLFVLSISPELFLLKRGRTLKSSPMKGTAARSERFWEDELVRNRLREDEKNRAENVMIVDLIRNDLGRVCEPGKVRVSELFCVESYRTLHQMISTIEGTLRRDSSLKEVFRALFPCGSVTGAPKVRTMQIISELEKEPRGVYTGAVGYFEPSLDFVFNVAIRTAVIREDKGEFGIGSGVVWDSDPVKEYEECVLKKRFLHSKLPKTSLVETFKFEPKKGYLRLERHLRRLKRSCSYFDISLNPSELAFYLEHMKPGNGSRVRIEVSEWGEFEVSFVEYRELKSPLKVVLVKRGSRPAFEYLTHKTVHRDWLEQARRTAEELGAQEAIFYDERGRLLEGTFTNVFLELNGRLYTPPVSLGILPGVLREELLETGRCEEREVTLEDLLRGRLYVGNSLRGLLRVDAVVGLVPEDSRRSN